MSHKTHKRWMQIYAILQTLLSDRGFESRMTSLWVSQWFCIANGSRKLKPWEIKSFVKRFLKKCCKNAVKMPFSNVAPTKQVALTWNSIWTNKMGCGIYIPNIKSLRHLDVCQYSAKCSEKAVFWTFLEFFKRGSHRNDSIDAKF